MFVAMKHSKNLKPPYKNSHLIGYLMVILLWALTRHLCVCVCVPMLIHTHLFSLLSAHFITLSWSILQFIDKSRKEETNSGLNSLIVTSQPTETAFQRERTHVCKSRGRLGDLCTMGLCIQDQKCVFLV